MSRTAGYIVLARQGVEATLQIAGLIDFGPALSRDDALQKVKARLAPECSAWNFSVCVMTEDERANKRSLAAALRDLRFLVAGVDDIYESMVDCILEIQKSC